MAIARYRGLRGRSVQSDLGRYKIAEVSRPAPGSHGAGRQDIPRPLERYFDAAIETLNHLGYGDPSDYIFRRTGEETPKSPLSEVWVPAIFRNDAKPNSEDTLSSLLSDADSCRLVLAGPGGGKSTLARFITCLAIQDYREGVRDRFGVFVPLSRYRADASYRKSIASCAAEFVGLQEDAEVIATLENSLESAFVVFDGLDELPSSPSSAALVSETRDRAVGHIKTLRADPQRAPNSPVKVQVIVTCRESEYLADPCLGKVATYRLTDFSTRQMSEAIAKWHARAKVLAATYLSDQSSLLNEIDGRAAMIAGCLRDNSDLGSLCHRPLMLAILQTVYASGEEIPSSVSHLCERAMQWLLLEKPAAVNQEAFVAKHAEWLWSAVSELALRIHERVAGGKAKAITGDELRHLCRSTCPSTASGAAGHQLRERMATEMFLHLIGGHGILVLGAGGDIDFAHNVFREVMAGRALGKMRVPELRKFALNESWHGPIRYWAGLKAVSEIGWHEISALVGELEADAEHDSIVAILAQAEMLVEVCSQSSKEKWTQDLQRRVAVVRQALLKSLRQAGLIFPHRLRVGDLLGALGDPRIEDSDFDRLVWIEGGDVEIGRATPHVTDIEKYQSTPASPVVRGRLQRYALGKYLVTNQEYAGFIRAGGYEQDRYWPNDQSLKWLHKDQATLDLLLAKAREAAQIHLVSELTGERLDFDDIPDWCDRMLNRRLPLYWTNSAFNRRNQPVVGINWWEAFAYCNWRTEVLRAEARLPDNYEVRLPIEAEWEVAARTCGGGNIYPWIDGEPTDNAHVRGQLKSSAARAARAVAIGSFEFVSCHLPSPIYDLVGNVWEWSGSIAAPYSQGSFVQKVIATNQSDRICRGSSWLSSERESSQVTFRSFDPPFFAYEDCGLRIAIGMRDPNGS